MYNPYDLATLKNQPIINPPAALSSVYNNSNDSSLIRSQENLISQLPFHSYAAAAAAFAATNKTYPTGTSSSNSNNMWLMAALRNFNQTSSTFSDQDSPQQSQYTSKHLETMNPRYR
jgi:hypothetical protein